MSLIQREQHRFFKFSLKWAVLTCAIIVFLLKLGFWQLSRAAEKKQQLASLQSVAQQTPMVWRPHDHPKPYQPIQITGHYLPNTLLLDNQFYQHQLGFYVLTPFQTKAGDIILVDRGWIARANQERFPAIEIPSGNKILQGYAYYPSQKGVLLGNAIEAHHQNDWMIEALDLKLIEKILQQTLIPFIMRLDKPSSDGLVHEWPMMVLPPERHYAYAVQWFAMAGAALIIYLVLSFRRS